jgi:hypothetical protein
VGQACTATSPAANNSSDVGSTERSVTESDCEPWPTGAGATQSRKTNSGLVRGEISRAMLPCSARGAALTYAPGRGRATGNTENRESRQAKRQRPSLLEEVLERRMLLYVLAAGATLAGASSAQAKAVFTRSDFVLSLPNGHLAIDLNNDGTTDFILIDHCVSQTSCFGSVNITARGYGQNAVRRQRRLQSATRSGLPPHLNHMGLCSMEVFLAALTASAPLPIRDSDF